MSWMSRCSRVLCALNLIAGSAAVDTENTLLLQTGVEEVSKPPPHQWGQASVGARTEATVDSNVVETTDSSSSDAASEHLWGGGDTLEDESEESAGLSRQESDASSAFHLGLKFRRTAKTPFIKLAGMFGSGTNLMAEYLKKNDFMAGGHVALDTSTAKACEDPNVANHLIPCKNFWKHTNPGRMEAWGSTPVTVVAMVRNPLSQMLSWRREPFNLASCMHDPYKKCSCAGLCDGVHCHQNRPWYPCDNVKDASSGLEYNFMTHPPTGAVRPSKRPSATYASLMDVWNTYVQGYANLSSSDISVTVHVVRYEDLVMSPEGTMKALALAMNMESDDVVKRVESNQRAFDPSSRSRASADNRIRNRLYRSDFGFGEIKKICTGLDKKLLKALSYNNDCE